MPKIERFEILVDGSPEQVAERIRAKTRYRLMPFQGSPFGGRYPLGGVVRGEGVRVALDPRDWLTMSQAVARARIEPAGEGRSRVIGEASLPPWMTWYLRVVVIGTSLLIGAALLFGLDPTASLTSLLGGVLYMFVVAGIAMGAIGWHVSWANSQVEGLVQTLTRVAASGGSSVNEAIRVSETPGAEPSAVRRVPQAE